MKFQPSQLAACAVPGDDVTKVIPSLIKVLRGVDKVTLITIARPAPVCDRFAQGGRIAARMQDATRFSRRHGVSLWSAALLGACGPERANSEELAELFPAALFHAPSDEALSHEEVTAADLTSDFLQERALSVPAGCLLALASRVFTRNGGQMHLPLLDFALDQTDENTSIVVCAAEQLGLPYLLMGTTHSYHYYGLQTLSVGHYLREFLGRASLLAPLVDARWIAHQQIDGVATLRLSADPQTGREPVLLCGSPWN